MGVFTKLHEERYQEPRHRRTKTPQLEITTEHKVFTLSSMPEEIATHWVWDVEKKLWRARRCSEDDLCEDCWRTRFDSKKEGNPDWLKASDVVLRFYFLCIYKDTEHWVELGARHALVLDGCETTVGTKVEAWKTGNQQQCHKMLRVVSQGNQVRERNAYPFLGMFCLPPRLVSRDDAQAFLMGIRELEVRKKKERVA